MDEETLRNEIISLYKKQAMDVGELSWFDEAEEIADLLLHRVGNNEYYAIEDLCYLYYCYEGEDIDFDHVFYWLDRADEENRNQYEFNRSKLEKLRDNCTRLKMFKDFKAGKVVK